VIFQSPAAGSPSLQLQEPFRRARRIESQFFFPQRATLIGTWRTASRRVICQGNETPALRCLTCDNYAPVYFHVIDLCTHTHTYTDHTHTYGSCKKKTRSAPIIPRSDYRLRRDNDGRSNPFQKQETQPSRIVARARETQLGSFSPDEIVGLTRGRSILFVDVSLLRSAVTLTRRPTSQSLRYCIPRSFSPLIEEFTGDPPGIR